MKARRSVRLVLVAGYGAMAVFVLSVGFVAMHDPTPPEGELTADTGERHAARARPLSRQGPSSWAGASGDAPPFSEEMALEALDVEAEPQTLGPAWDPTWEANPPGAGAAMRDELAVLADDRAELLDAMTGGSDSNLDDERSVQRALDIAQAELVPVYEGTDLVGLRVGSLSRGSYNFLSDIGVHGGDVITSINGRSLKDSEGNPWLMLEELRSPDKIALTVIDSRGVESRHFTD